MVPISFILSRKTKLSISVIYSSSVNSYFKISKPYTLLAGTGLTKLVLNICLNFVVNEHYDFKCCCPLGMLWYNIL